MAYYDKTALTAAVAQAKAIKASDYTSASYAKLTAALTQAESVLAMDKVSQSIGEIAMKELQDAIDGLVEVSKPADSSSTSAPAPSDEKKGCGSVIGTEISMALLGAAAVVMKKKKQD